MANEWFSVDRDGLAKLIEKRGKAFVLFELIQNAWDTDTKQVSVWLKPVKGKPYAELEVQDDDPNGFADLAHAYTLFAESVKKDDPTKRGRFNLGEKLVLALCKTATIRSTKGSVIFTEDGKRTQTGRGRTTAGSVFEATIRMTRSEYDEVCKEVFRLIPPVQTVFNGKVLPTWERAADFRASLQTIKADDEGNLSKTKRMADVEVYEPQDDEPGWIYEMGIPVVETGDKYHVDVKQKVPVSLDRDNVPPSYLRTLRALVLNEMHDRLDEEDATANWVTDAISHDDVSGDAVEAVLTERFGEKRAIYDPSDQEANQRLVSEGYTVISGGTLSKEAWRNVKQHSAAVPSGTLRPTPKPYSSDPNADPADEVPEDKWTDSIREVVELSKRLARELMDVDLNVNIMNTSNGFAACYGRDGLFGPSMDFNLRRLGHKWFNNWQTNDGKAKVLDLIIHEFGHHYASSHLSTEYHDALTDLGGRMAVLALRSPEIFDPEC